MQILSLTLPCNTEAAEKYVRKIMEYRRNVRIDFSYDKPLLMCSISETADIVELEYEDSFHMIVDSLGRFTNSLSVCRSDKKRGSFVVRDTLEAELFKTELYALIRSMTGEKHE